MFGFFKKLFARKKKDAKNEVVNTEEKKDKLTYKPELGTVDAFKEKFNADPKHLAIGRKNNENIMVNAEHEPCNDITFINDNATSIKHDIVMPIVRQGNLSYVVYDPEGEYFKALGNNMLDRGYDVQVIDFEDEEKSARINLFEIVNITQNAYWVATVFAGASG